MSPSTPTIRSVKARAVDAPISRPVKNAFGVIRSAPLVLIDVATHQGITGGPYIFCYTPLTLNPLGAAGADRCRNRSGDYRALVHLCLYRADAKAAGAID